MPTQKAINSQNMHFEKQNKPNKIVNKLKKLTTLKHILALPTYERSDMHI